MLDKLENIVYYKDTEEEKEKTKNQESNERGESSEHGRWTKNFNGPPYVAKLKELSFTDK